MKILTPKSPGYAKELARLNRRAIPPADVQESVATILATVRKKGDAALLEFAAKFDRVKLSAEQLAVSKKEWDAAIKSVPAAVREALEASHRNVLAFSRKSLRQDWSMKNAQGATVGEIFRPFQRVGLYIPGGSAPLVSTVIMTATLAQAAGCPEVVACTPCGPDGKINAAMLLALRLAGVTEVYRIGGAQAIGAMAFGTPTIRPVEKIFGPGNKYVVEAKRQVFGAVAIDLLPGPSEIMVLCDETANPAFVAADLLAQAEHGHDGEITLVTPSAKLIKEVSQQVEDQLKLLPRAAIVREILEKGAWLIQVPSMKQGIALCNAYAPEHLSLVVREEATVIDQIHTAGAIFVGNFSPVAAGDFAAGPSHTLPTGGAGKSFPGLTVDQFQRRTSIVKLDPASLKKTEPIIRQFSEIEGLQAHGFSAAIRLGIS